MLPSRSTTPTTTMPATASPAGTAILPTRSRTDRLKRAISSVDWLTHLTGGTIVLLALTVLVLTPLYTAWDLYLVLSITTGIILMLACVPRLRYSMWLYVPLLFAGLFYSVFAKHLWLLFPGLAAVIISFFGVVITASRDDGIDRSARYRQFMLALYGTVAVLLTVGQISFGQTASQDSAEFDCAKPNWAEQLYQQRCGGGGNPLSSGPSEGFGLFGSGPADDVPPPPADAAPASDAPGDTDRRDRDADRDDSEVSQPDGATDGRTTNRESDGTDSAGGPTRQETDNRQDDSSGGDQSDSSSGDTGLTEPERSEPDRTGPAPIRTVPERDSNPEPGPGPDNDTDSGDTDGTVGGFDPQQEVGINPVLTDGTDALGGEGDVITSNGEEAPVS